MPAKPPIMLWLLPVVLAAVIAWVGWRHYEFVVGVTGMKGSQLQQYRREETLRWVGSSGAALVLSTVIMAAVWWRARTLAVRLGKYLAVAFLFVYSCAPAYWPERELIRQGWYVHPSKIAIHGPGVSALLMLAVTVAMRAHMSRRAAP